MTVHFLRAVLLSSTALSLLACVSGPAIEGQAMADRLNTLYSTTVDDCAGQPAYVCSGVAVRVLDPFNSNLQPLDPTPTQIGRNGASFSFIRKDLNIRHLYQAEWAGYVMGMHNPPGFTPLQARCAFPTDAYTDSRPDSCGRSRMDMTPTLKSRPCAEQGIDTEQAWGSYFAGIADQRFTCSFDADTEGFRLSMASRSFIPADNYRHEQWNELIIAIWKQEDVRQLPVEAMFYTPEDFVPFWRVQTHQCRIYFATGRRVPLLKLDLESGDGRVFSFNPAEQIDFDAATPACIYAPQTSAKP